MGIKILVMEELKISMASFFWSIGIVLGLVGSFFGEKFTVDLEKRNKSDAHENVEFGGC